MENLETKLNDFLNDNWEKEMLKLSKLTLINILKNEILKSNISNSFKESINRQK